MNDLAVMYHYVKDKKGWNGISPLDPNVFIRQIELLNKTYDIVSPDDLDLKSRKPKCVLTFDDGTKDQFTHAFEILNTKGIPAYFTVMSGPLVNGEVPVFNLVHTVLSLYSDEEIWEALKKEFDLTNIERLSSIYNYENNSLRRYNKYALNFMLSEKESRNFLEKKVFYKFGNKENFIDAYYINKEEFIKMNKAGMTLGVHCVSHSPYCGNASEFYDREIEPCAKFMKNELNITPKWYTPAFGGGEKFKDMILDLEPILKSNGFRGGFTTIKGLNRGLSNFWLNRYDCVNIPPVYNINLENLT